MIPVILSLLFTLMGTFVSLTLITDRFEDLRYLLNFVGVKSSAYILGITLADTLLCVVPNIIFIYLATIFGIPVFLKKSGEFIFTVFVYSF